MAAGCCAIARLRSGRVGSKRALGVSGRKTFQETAIRSPPTERPSRSRHLLDNFLHSTNSSTRDPLQLDPRQEASDPLHCSVERALRDGRCFAGKCQRYRISPRVLTTFWSELTHPQRRSRPEYLTSTLREAGKCRQTRASGGSGASVLAGISFTVNKSRSGAIAPKPQR